MDDSNLPEGLEIDVWSRNNPRSIYNSVEKGFRQKMSRIHARILDMNEDELKEKGEIKDCEEALRIQFWMEFNRFNDSRRSTLKATNVYLGICTRRYFEEVVCGNQYKLAFILSPPRQYHTDMKMLLSLALSKKREILAMSSYDSNGEPNDRLITVQAKLAETVQDRLFGTSVARSAKIETRVPHESEEGKKLLKANNISYENAASKIRELSERLSLPIVEVIDAEEVSE